MCHARFHCLGCRKEISVRDRDLLITDDGLRHGPKDPALWCGPIEIVTTMVPGDKLLSS